MSKLLSNIPKHRRELVRIIEDGSAKTFVYKDLDEKTDEKTKDGLLVRLFRRKQQSLK